MEEKIIEIIAKVLQVSVDDVTPDVEIGEFDEWDSLHHLAIFAELGRQFNINITQDMLVDLENVEDIFSLVRDLTK